MEGRGEATTALLRRLLGLVVLLGREAAGGGGGPKGLLRARLAVTPGSHHRHGRPLLLVLLVVGVLDEAPSLLHGHLHVLLGRLLRRVGRVPGRGHRIHPHPHPHGPRRLLHHHGGGCLRRTGGVVTGVLLLRVRLRGLHGRAPGRGR